MKRNTEVEKVDSDLVDRARQGDVEAMNRLVALHHRAVYRVAYQLLGEEDGAADVAQVTFVRAFKALPGYRGDGKFRSWLLTISRNEARGVLRKKSRRGKVSLDAADTQPSRDPLPDTAVQEKEEFARIDRLLEPLPDKQRMAVFLRVFQEMSFREIGYLIGSTEGAARVNYHHGICKLRKSLA